ncbi:MAG: aromatic ring-hydroxylating dioxygenase subunit alpha [Gammaproteobacteria bacterium]|nr:aromatic ring-hydroxylating dioxygenase subunit alpha [Gammaproteobacteria bacterium]
MSSSTNTNGDFQSSKWTKDGINGLIDDISGTLDPRIYVDKDLYELELKNIFGRSWNFLAHETQIPNPGDFFQNYIGEDAVLVVRQADGSVSGFLNMCRHRGMKICRTDCGNAKTFTCSYHGWSYDRAGNLINVPMKKEAYRDEIKLEDWGPPKLEKIESYKGLIFGTWDPNAPSLTSYLGPMTFYLDHYLDRSGEGTRALGGVHKWVIPSNWKMAAEQFCDDMYHVDYSHASAMIAQLPEGADPSMASFPKDGNQFGCAEGHACSFWASPFSNAGSGPAAMEFILGPEREEALQRLGKDRVNEIAGMNSTVFPNFSLLGAGAFTIRTWHPKGPDETEIWSMIIVNASTPDEIVQAFRKNIIRTFSPAGTFEQDDTENWAEMQRVFRGTKAQATSLNAGMGLGHAHQDERFPGTINFGYAEEGARLFYRRWKEMLTTPTWRDMRATLKEVS